MARSYKQADMKAGDIVTPVEMNEEFRSVIGELNGHLDRDNLPAGTVTDRDKIAVDTFNTIFFTEDVTSVAITRSGFTDRQQWFDVDGMVATITTGDGALEIEAQITLSVQADQGSFDFGIFVDGTLVARSDPELPAKWNRDSKCLDVEVPVGAGPHTIKSRIRIQPDGGGAGVGLTQTQTGRCLWVRHLKR